MSREQWTYHHLGAFMAHKHSPRSPLPSKPISNPYSLYNLSTSFLARIGPARGSSPAAISQLMQVELAQHVLGPRIRSRGALI
jgi:hypothetical protein